MFDMVTTLSLHYHALHLGLDVSDIQLETKFRVSCLIFICYEQSWEPKIYISVSGQLQN